MPPSRPRPKPPPVRPERPTRPAAPKRPTPRPDGRGMSAGGRGPEGVVDADFEEVDDDEQKKAS